MREVQASEAETYLPQLLDEVERGETIVITRRGRAIARIVPEVVLRQQEIDSAIESIRALRKRTGRITLDDLLWPATTGTDTDAFRARCVRHRVLGIRRRGPFSCQLGR